MRTTNWLAGVVSRLINASVQRGLVRQRESSHRRRLFSGTTIVEHLEPRKLLSATPLGSEALVNTYTTNYQRFPAAASDSAGDYVIAWSSTSQASSVSNEDIYAQRYNSAGIAQGSEFLVNTYITNAQSAPSVAMDSAGDFVIVWQSYGQAGSMSNTDIYAQRFDSSGTAQGGEFLVNAFTTGLQSTPAVAMDATGDFAITWRSTNEAGVSSGYDVYARLYTSSGTAQSGEFLVNTFTTSDQQTPAVAMDAAGNFVITWESYNQLSAASRYDIFAQRYDEGGTAQGTEFLVNTDTLQFQMLPTVAMDLAGDFVISWSSSNQAELNSGFDIFAQRFDSSGAAQGSEFQVNTFVTQNQFAPDVAMDAVGDFVVTWQSDNEVSAGSSYDIYAQLYNRSGTAQGGEFLVNTITENLQAAPAVAMDAIGDFVIAWEYASDGNSYDNYAQRFQANLNSAPLVTTSTSTAITYTTATLGGDVTGDGSNALTAVGILYALTSDNSNPQIGGTGVTNLPGTPATGIFTLDVTGLSLGTEYSFVAYATNFFGTTYTSPASTFTTLANHSPSGTSKTVTTLENTSYVFQTSDFGFSDANDSPANMLLAVKFSLLPNSGTLKDHGRALTANQIVSASDISTGQFTFTPSTYLSGGPYFLAKFQVEDDGGTVNGGVDLDPIAKILDANITRVNQAPAGTSSTLTWGKNTPYTFKKSDFGFKDPNDNPANVLLGVKLTLLPSAGAISDNGVPVSANQLVSVSDINAGKLVFIPHTNLVGGPYFLSKFQVEDNGGTANGGVNLDPISKVLDIELLAVNHAPVGTSGTLTAGENAPYVFRTSDFGFTDPNDTPPNTLLGVRFSLLPNAGTITDNGVALTLNQIVSAAEITSGKLIFTPQPGLNGGPYFLTKFQVEDNGGTAVGGVNLDPAPKNLHVKLTR